MILLSFVLLFAQDQGSSLNINVRDYCVQGVSRFEVLLDIKWAYRDICYFRKSSGAEFHLPLSPTVCDETGAVNSCGAVAASITLMFFVRAGCEIHGSNFPVVGIETPGELECLIKQAFADHVRGEHTPEL